MRTYLYICFMDYTKAFDRARHDEIINTGEFKH